MLALPLVAPATGVVVPGLARDHYVRLDADGAARLEGALWSLT